MTANTKFTKSEAIPPDAKHDPSSLKGKSVIITGGASGIGEQCLQAFVKAGAFVTFGDVADDLGEAIASSLGTEKVAFVHYQLHLFKTALSHSPSNTIDIVLANAGINRSDDITLQTASLPNGDPVEPDLSVLDVNFTGVMYTTKLALYYFPQQPQDDENRDRSIIITGSMASYMDHAQSPQYNASKFGVRGLMRSLRRTGPGEGIRINMIAPWFTDTRIMQGARPQIEAHGIEFVEIEDVGNGVLHLASDKSINGRAISIVPKSVSQRGYLDLEKDDLVEDDFWGLARTARTAERSAELKE
ncbi:related to short-chain alcohol dehydrogenase [Ramularia collo-cygni]|uniref:Related to short-chain alcohol dehydrogenase n=1 Tax=Ramularia collo-cygni TaxID=112498 RepID=A0A2D3V0D9_9PEZI|nr:related to short-chain alcohol dehydrogenase [Ramularia collo-cygni]CZT18950.1 related to short-chain alcohol dehydrogenase [Ramularia collo-cygni]